MSFSDKEIFFNYSYKGFFISDEIYIQLSYKKQTPQSENVKKGDCGNHHLDSLYIHIL